MTPFDFMPYDVSDKGKAFRLAHAYRKLSQVGGNVEFEFKFCSDNNCSCHLAAVGAKESAVELVQP